MENPSRKPFRQVAEINRRARNAGVEGMITLEDRNRLYTIYNNSCLACGSPENLTVDHVIPLYSGGSNNFDNLQLLCRPCNEKKRTRSFDFRLNPYAWSSSLTETITNYDGPFTGEALKEFLDKGISSRELSRLTGIKRRTLRHRVNTAQATSKE